MYRIRRCKRDYEPKKIESKKDTTQRAIDAFANELKDKADCISDIVRKDISDEVKLKALMAIKKMIEDKEYREKVEFRASGCRVDTSFTWTFTEEGFSFWDNIYRTNYKHINVL